uniref:Uncharacterized protein n=1 Tax=Arundo donax TaxID=35708 RepID=A0A0A9G7T6_ARUDO
MKNDVFYMYGYVYVLHQIVKECYKLCTNTPKTKCMALCTCCLYISASEF